MNGIFCINFHGLIDSILPVTINKKNKAMKKEFVISFEVPAFQKKPNDEEHPTKSKVTAKFVKCSSVTYPEPFLEYSLKRIKKTYK